MNSVTTIVFTAMQRLVAIGQQSVLQLAASAPQESEATNDLGDKMKDHVADVSETLNQNEAVQQVSAGILEPIYQVGEFMSFSSFYWVAFALMVAGVIAFAGQLFLAKFFLLFKGSLNIREIISDFFCLLVSLIGLVLTTQSAATHHTFTTNSVAVISATAVGGLLGLVFYWWGQKTEFDAANKAKPES